MENEVQKEDIVHPLLVEESNLPMNKIFIIFVGLVVAGVITGFIIATVTGRTPPKQAGTSAKKSEAAPERAGLADKQTFKDSAEGILREGGLNGEGNFHLERLGGESQNVYLTSTTVDLSQYIGKKVKVWGETFAAQKAGWLMDVGLIEVL